MKQSKKAKAFALFSQGYTTTCPEVKAIGLHPANRYKYFNEWQRLGKPTEPESHQSQPAMANSKAPGSGETIGSIDETKAKPKNDQEEKPKPPETLSQEEQIPEGVEEEVGEDLEEDLTPEDQRQQSPPKLEQSRKPKGQPEPVLGFHYYDKVPYLCNSKNIGKSSRQRTILNCGLEVRNRGLV